jgi:cell division septation protein DedD
VTAILKQRLVGAIVLISLGIIFIPMLLTGTDGLTTGELPTNIPPKPLYEIQAPATLPLERKNLPEPVLEPIPEPDSTPVSEKQTVEKPAPVEEKVDVAVIEPVPEVEKKTETVAPAKSESKSTATKPAAKSETTEQKTAVKWKLPNKNNPLFQAGWCNLVVFQWRKTLSSFVISCGKTAMPALLNLTCAITKPVTGYALDRN